MGQMGARIFIRRTDIHRGDRPARSSYSRLAYKGIAVYSGATIDASS